jgi:hypothetical protein
MLTSPTRSRSVRVRTAALAGLTGAAVLATVSGATASSHREAPLTSVDPIIDSTDVYAFTSPERAGFVTLVANWIPAQDPAAGPNYWRFGEEVLYAINVDSNGDAVEDVTYEWRFRNEIVDGSTFLYTSAPFSSAKSQDAQIRSLDDPDYNFRQRMDVFVVRNGQRTKLVDNAIVPPSNIGPVATPDYPKLAAEGVRNIDGSIPEAGGRVFAGQRDDSFYADIGSIFDQGQLRPALSLYKPAPRDNQPGRDFFAGYNVHTTTIEVPIAAVRESAQQPVIGVWATASRPKVRVYSQNSGASPVHRGRFVQVSRLGNPLVNEVVIPLAIKDTYSTLKPSQDAAALSRPADSRGVTIPLVQDPELGKLIEGLYGINVPDAPRNDLVGIFLTGTGPTANPNAKPADVLRLNTNTAPDDVAWPNGRKFGDDVVDTALSAVAGTSLTDGANANDGTFLSTFPYAPLPWQGFAEDNTTRGKATQ